MKYFFLTFTICLWLAGCNLSNQDNKIKSGNTLKNKISSSLNDSLKTKTILKANNCDCKLIIYDNNTPPTVAFNNSKYSKIKNDILFKNWSNDSLINQVKSIRFSGFDTIPKKYSLFKKVNKVIIENRNGIYGLDIFPNLKFIHFFGSVINLNTNEKWPYLIETLDASKTKLTGLNSFKKMPNLRALQLEYSGFDKFPKNLESLECLSRITLGAYMYGGLDLSKLNLSQNKCLKKVVFHSWYASFSGMPSGLLDSNIEKINISHSNLTPLEKEELKKITDQLSMKKK